MVGKNVVVGLHGSAAPFNTILEAVSDAGIKVMSTEYPWEQVVRLTPMTPTDIPGAKPPKLTAAEKKAVKAKEEVDARFAERSKALAQALDLVTAVLGGEGKVTKKAFEALKPQLEVALAYQGELQSAGASGQVSAPGSTGEPLYPLPQVLSALDETVRRIVQVQTMVKQNAGLP